MQISTEFPERGMGEKIQEHCNGLTFFQKALTKITKGVCCSVPLNELGK